MKKKKSLVFKPEPVKEIYHAHEPGTPVIVQKTKHSGVTPGAKGTIIARCPDGGYAVEFEAVARTGLFGGSYAESAIIYLEPYEFIVDATRLHATESQGCNGKTPSLNGEGGPIVNDSSQGNPQ